MDYLPGGDLTHFIKGGLALPAVRFYAAEVILALEYIHRDLGIAHRDVKVFSIRNN